MEELPSTFDLVIVGTGLTESIVSAAAARVGHSVLHLDPRDYYGGKWGTMCWNSWTSGSFAQDPESLKPEEYGILGSFELDGTVTNLVWRNDVRNLHQHWYAQSPSLRDEVSSLSRRFNVDILPKVLMAREETISLLINSNVSRYLQFSCIKRLMSSLPPPNESTIEPIPLSRSDIFTSKSISLIEKRKLMKFIEYVLKSSDETSPETGNKSLPSKTFHELAKIHNLSSKVQHLIHSAVRTMDDCMEISGNIGDEDGQAEFNLKFSQNCRLFLQSINRYGNQTPFLWTLYGISEICQSFCRLSAIYGGTFILNRAIESIHDDPDESTSLINIRITGAEIKCKYIVLGPEFKLEAESRSKSPKCRQGITLVRGVLLLSGDGPLLASPLNHPVQNNNDPSGSSTVYRFGDMDVIELDESSLAVPKNYRLLQVTLPYREGNTTPRQIIEARLEAYVNFNPPAAENPCLGLKSGRNTEDPPTNTEQPKPSSSSSEPNTRPTVIHGSYFLIDFYDDIRDQDKQNPKLYSCSTSSTELTDHVEKARDIFSKMFPEDEFLPKAPDAPEHVQEEELEEDPERELGLGGGGEPQVLEVENMDGHGPQDNIVANHFDDHPQMDYIQNGVVDGE